MGYISKWRGRMTAAMAVAAALAAPAAAANAADASSRSPRLTAVMFSGPAGLDREETTVALKSGNPLASLGLQEAGQRPVPTLASYKRQVRSLQRDSRAAHVASIPARPAAATVPFDPTK